MTAAPTRRRSLHRDENGQISALGVAAAAVFACLLVLVMNTGYATSGKIQMQNAADATAISGATWIARGLNLVSLNNVTQTQLLAMYLLVPSIAEAAEKGMLVLNIQIGICSLAGPFSPICMVPLQIQRTLLNAFQIAIRVVQNVTGNGKIFYQTAKILSTFSTAIVRGFPLLAEAESIRIARQNEADVGVLIPAPTAGGRFQFSLPARAGKLRPDLCDPLKNGSPAMNRRGYSPLYGYRIGQGPLDVITRPVRWSTYPFFNTGMPWFFDAFLESNYRQLCGGAGAPPTYDRPVRSLPECRAAGGTAQWVVRRFDTRPLTMPDNSVRSIEAGDGRLERNSPTTQNAHAPCSWTPPGAPYGQNAWRTVSGPVTRVTGFDQQGRPIYSYTYQVVEYRFVLGSVVSEAQPTVDAPSEGDEPYPYLLGSKAASDDAIRSELRYLAVAYRERPVSVAPAYFVSPLGAYRLTYAQAKVYNPTAFDLFTQDWRVSLEPSSMIEDGSLVRAVGGGAFGNAFASAPASAPGFQSALGLLTGNGANFAFMGSVNNH